MDTSHITEVYIQVYNNTETIEYAHWYLLRRYKVPGIHSSENSVYTG